MKKITQRFALGVCLLITACAPQPIDQGQAKPDMGTDKAASLMRIARASLEAGDVASAADLYLQATRQENAPAEAYERLLDSYIALGKINEARDVMKTAADKHPDNADFRNRQIGLELRTDTPTRALPLVEHAIAKFPQDARFYNLKGVALDKIGKHTDAQEAYAQGLARSVSHAGIRTNLGMSYILSGDYAEAIRVLKAVVDEGSDTAQTRQNLALAYGLSGDREAASQWGLQDLSSSEVKENLHFYEYLAEHGFSPVMEEEPVVAE